MHLCDPYTFVLLIEAVEVFTDQLVKPLSGLLTASFLYFVEIYHSVLEVDNLEVGVWKVHLVEISHHIRDGPRAMELPRELVEYQAHPCHILNRKCSYSSIRIIIHECQYLHIVLHVVE